MAGPTTRDGTGRARTINALVEAAIRLFGERGPGAVSLREVAAEAGVNYGLIHQYVGTKDELLALVFKTVSANSAARIAEDSDASTSLDRLMSADTAASAYVRMLAWTLLEGRDPAQFLGRSPALHELAAAIHRDRTRGRAPAGEADVEDRIRVAAAVSLALGWRMFGSFVRSASDIDDLDIDEVTARIRDLGEQLVRDQ
jgi:AcrR family transcriptional regulator